MTWHLTSAGRFFDTAEPTVVYFDPASGDTHLVSDFAAHLLRQLGDCPMTSADLVQQLVAAGGEDASVLAVAVSAALQELQALDIISPQ